MKQKVLWELAIRNIIKNRHKYIVALLAVVLTAVLFSATIALGCMLFTSVQEAQFQLRGDSSMAALRFLLPEEYGELREDKNLKKAAYSIIISSFECNGLVVEVRYGEDDFASNMYSFPTSGRMPQDRSEFAASIQTLEAMGAEAQVGEEVELSFFIGDCYFSDVFVLSGYWDADNMVPHRQCWLSKAFCDEMVPEPVIPVYDQEHISYAGYYMMDIDFKNSINVGRQIERLLQRHGYDPSQVICQINDSYLWQGSIPVLLGFLVVFGAFLLVGYLLIYNIFHIRILLDTQYYALLATLGMDTKQLGTAVRVETVLISIVGTPIGIVFGKWIADFLLPYVAGFLSFDIVTEYRINWLVYVLIFVFTSITVYLSCKKPISIVQRLSPIVGLDYQGNVRKHNRQSLNGELQIWKMAWWNILREKGKLWTVVVAVSLSVIIFNSVYSLVGGFNLEKYLSGRIDSDYIVTDDSILNMKLTRKLDAISPEVREQIEHMEGIKDLKYTYMCKGNIILAEQDKQRIRQMQSGSAEDFMEESGIHTVLSCQIYGLDSEDAAAIIFQEGSWNPDKFISGEYAIVSASSADEILYHQGENITLLYPDGSEKTYEVLGVGEVPYVVSARYWIDLGVQVILPVSEYMEKIDNTGAMMLRVNKDKVFSAEESFYQIVSDAGLICMSREEYIKEFEDFKNAYLLIGGMLTGVIGLIGLLNFANTIITSVNYRERELTILNIIGMTEKQCVQLLLCEGMYYALLSIIFIDTVGLAVSYGAVRFMSRLFEFVDWNFNVIVLAIGNIMFLLVSCIATLLTYKLMGKKKIMSRLQKFSL